MGPLKLGLGFNKARFYKALGSSLWWFWFMLLFLSATLGSMAYGKDMESCTLMETWCSRLERAIFAKIGSMPKCQGTRPTTFAYDIGGKMGG